MQVPWDERAPGVGYGGDVHDQEPKVPEEEEHSDPQHDIEDDGTVQASSASGSRSGSTAGAAGRGGRRNYHEDLASAVAVGTRLPSCQIGAVELLTFFPNHTQWPEAGLRLYRNGFKHKEIAKVQLQARGKLDKASQQKREQALRHQISTNGKIFFNDPNFTLKNSANLMTPVRVYDASNYVPRPRVTRSAMTTARLVNVARGITIWPAGEDRGIVTQVIEYAHQHNDLQYTIADIPQLAQQLGFVAPHEASTAQWDQNANTRAQGVVIPDLVHV